MKVFKVSFEPSVYTEMHFQNKNHINSTFFPEGKVLSKVNENGSPYTVFECVIQQ